MIPGLKAIPAFNGAGSAGTGGGGGALSLAFLTFSSSTSTTITIPASARAGDWAILFQVAEDPFGSSISSVTPSGWTTVADVVAAGSSLLRSMVSHRILTSSGGTSITGMGGYRRRKLLLVFRPSTTIISAVSSTWNEQGTADNPSSQSVTASGATAPLIVFAMASAGSTIPSFTTETPSMTNLTNGTLPSMRVGYTVYNSSPANQSIDCGDVGSTTSLQSGYLRFT